MDTLAPQLLLDCERLKQAETGNKEQSGGQDCETQCKTKDHGGKNHTIVLRSKKKILERHSQLTAKE